MPICTYRKSLCSQSTFKTESCRLILDHCIIMILMKCAVNEVAITERVKKKKTNCKEKPSHDLTFNEVRSHKLVLVVLGRRAEGN